MQTAARDIVEQYAFRIAATEDEERDIGGCLANRRREQRFERLATRGMSVVDDERRRGRYDAKERSKKRCCEEVEAIDVARPVRRQCACGLRRSSELSKVRKRFGRIAIRAIGAKPQQPSGTGRGPRHRERALAGTGSGGEIRSAALDRFVEQTMEAWPSQRARRARNRKLGEARRAWHPNEGY